MAYVQTGMQALFPVYLARMAGQDVQREAYDVSVAQNETNLNQNLETLFCKLAEIEAYLASADASAQTGGT